MQLVIPTLFFIFSLNSLLTALPIQLDSGALPSLQKDPVTDLKVLQILSYWGYPGEEHHVVTRDGYNLTIHRIPHGRSQPATKGVIFLQHGLLCSSADFILNLPSQSLGFMLADHGYDVWLGKCFSYS